MALSHPESIELTNRVIGSAIAVHRELGPGLLEHFYEKALGIELEESNHRVERQRSIPIIYRSRPLNGVYRPDMIVNDLVLLEVKAVEKVIPVHKAQVLTYLKLTGLKVGLLLNFNTTRMADGIFRISL